MQVLMKIGLIILMFIIGGGILGVMKDTGGGNRPGPMGVIIAMAFIAGIKAIWSYSSEKPKDKNTTDIEKLDKN